MADSTIQDMDTALQQLARALQTPLVPGDLEKWLADVERLLGRVGELLPRHLEEIRDDYATIDAADQELLRRVEQMKEGDVRTRQWLAALQARLDPLARRVRLHEPDEIPVEQALQEFANEGLSFVLHVQKQEVARTTWLQEAFNRVHGPKD